MKWLVRTLCDPFAHGETLRRASYGAIETRAGRLESIRLRAWPKIATALEARSLGRRCHGNQPGDRCWLYYNQPRAFKNFLALKYVVSQRDCSLATFHRAMEILDEVARIKGTDAIVCDAWNMRISDRLLARWGWEAHNPHAGRRHFIKRFYGTYPAARAEVQTATITAASVLAKVGN